MCNKKVDWSKPLMTRNGKKVLTHKQICNTVFLKKVTFDNVFHSCDAYMECGHYLTNHADDAGDLINPPMTKEEVLSQMWWDIKDDAKKTFDKLNIGRGRSASFYMWGDDINLWDGVPIVLQPKFKHGEIVYIPSFCCHGYINKITPLKNNAGIIVDYQYKIDPSPVEILSEINEKDLRKRQPDMKPYRITLIDRNEVKQDILAVAYSAADAETQVNITKFPHMKIANISPYVEVE